METNPLKITELVLRDAHQSLLATRMRTEDMLPIGEKLDQVNAKTSKEEYKKGKAYYDKGKYREAMRHLSKVTTGNDLKTAKDLIKKIRESQSHLAE